MDIIGLKVIRPTQEQVEAHYSHIKGTPFFKGVVQHLLGELHNQKKIILLIYYGEDAIKKCRKIAGTTNPEEAEPTSIRGAFGRVTTKGIFENLVHVSSTMAEAKREIKLWFRPDEVMKGLYPTKNKQLRNIKKEFGND